jgi:hypothetical protein
MTALAQTSWKRARFSPRWAVVIGLLGGLVSCGGGAKAPTESMARFNAALCPAPPRVDTSRPLDPNLDGVKGNVALLSRTVTSTRGVRIAVTFRNDGQHGITLSLPRGAFTLGGFSLVDHDCRPVPYAQSTTAHALGYGNSGPMPLNIGESATIDSSLDDLAPGLVLPPGIYAIRLELKMEPVSAVVRGGTILSDWALFAVVPATK